MHRISVLVYAGVVDVSVVRNHRSQSQHRERWSLACFYNTRHLQAKSTPKFPKRCPGKKRLVGRRSHPPCPPVCPVADPIRVNNSKDFRTAGLQSTVCLSRTSPSVFKASEWTRGKVISEQQGMGDCAGWGHLPSKTKVRSPTAHSLLPCTMLSSTVSLSPLGGSLQFRLLDTVEFAGNVFRCAMPKLVSQAYFLHRLAVALISHHKVGARVPIWGPLLRIVVNKSRLELPECHLLLSQVNLSSNGCLSVQRKSVSVSVELRSRYPTLNILSSASFPPAVSQAEYPSNAHLHAAGIPEDPLQP